MKMFRQFYGMFIPESMLFSKDYFVYLQVTTNYV